MISPVGKVVDHGKEICFPSGMEKMGPVIQKLYDTLTGIQMGRDRSSGRLDPQDQIVIERIYEKSSGILAPELFLELKLERKQKEKVAYLRDFLSGAEGNRTPVRKPIPCSSTIIVCYLTFPLPHGNRHSCGFSSFMIRPCTQSLVHVVSHIVDARFLMCECTKADSSH